MQDNGLTDNVYYRHVLFTIFATVMDLRPTRVNLTQLGTIQYNASSAKWARSALAEANLLGSPGAAPGGSNDNLALSLHELKEEMAESRVITTTHREQKENGWASLAPNVQDALLHLGGTVSRGSFHPLAEPTDALRALLKQKSSAFCVQHIEQIIVDATRLPVSIPNKTAVSFLRGLFDWDSPSVPSNFALCTIRVGTVDDTAAQTLLHLKATEGKGLSEEDIKAMTKVGLHPARSFHELKESLQVWTAFAHHLFGSHSFLVSEMEDLLEELTRSRAHLEALSSGNHLLYTQVQYRIDAAIHSYMTLCRTSRSSIGPESIDLQDIVKEISRHSFSCSLPACLMPADRDQPRSPPRAAKKQRTDTPTKGDRSQVQNPAPHNDLALRSGESWKKFAGQYVQMVPSHPSLGKVCHRFHSLGNCFDDCKKAATHNNSVLEDTEVLSDYKKWMAKCRSE